MTAPPPDTLDRQALLELLFDRSPVPQALVDPESGTIRSVNASLANWIGARPAELIGSPFPNWDDLKASRQSIASWPQGAASLNATATMTLAEGDHPVALCVVQPEWADAVREDTLRLLQHRLRNMLAVIRSIFRRTAQNSDSVELLVAHFLGRLDAFARVGSNVALYDRFGVDLDDLIFNELAAHAARPDERFVVSGPPVRLRTKAAETLSLAIHELATNSVKYGALGSMDATVSIEWRFLKNPGMTSLFFTWIERGVTEMPDPPMHQGFGYDLLTNSLKFELDATSEVRLNPDGLELHIIVPVNDRLLHQSD